MANVVTRFPPSPTGFLHIGRARTALYNYIYAKQNGGRFVFRIEDTDKERSKKEYADDIIESLSWLGIKYDAGPFYQSDRLAIYKKYLAGLIEKKLAYVAEDEMGPGEEAKGKRQTVIRFKNPNKRVAFDDLIRGKIEFDTTDLGDFVIAKSVDEPLYHLAVVVDDSEMGVTHVIRGEDGISNTPRQILIQEAIGAARPIYAHLPLILAPDRTKLSGRHGAVSVSEYRAKGYLPEALVNYLALIGWNPGDDRELLSLEELIKIFDIGKVQKGGAIFDLKKLEWMNKEYLKKLTPAERMDGYKKRLKNLGFAIADDLLLRLEPIITERINKFGDIDALLSAGDLQYFWQQPVYDKSQFLWKGQGSFEDTARILNQVKKMLEDFSGEGWQTDSIKNTLMLFAEKEGRGLVLWPLRYALSGLLKSADPFTIAAVAGKDESVRRLEKAIDVLEHS